MKLAKLSLAAIVAVSLSTSVFAADNLAQAFKEGKVAGSATAYYFDRDNGATDQDIFDLGLDLTYKSGSFYGFMVGATFQGTHTPDADAAQKAMFAGDMYGSGAVLSEAYVAYNIANTTIKVGRQYISTPLVAGSGSRATKESFQGILALNTDIPNTTVAFGYVDKFQTRTERSGGGVVGNGNIGQFGSSVYAGGVGYVTVEDAWTALLINKSITNLTLLGQYANVNNVAGTGGDVTAFYLQGDYKIPTDMANFTLSAQYGSSSTDNVISTTLDGDVLGFKVAAAMDNGLSGYVAYDTNDNSNGTVSGLGVASDWQFAGSMIYGATYQKDTDTLSVNAAYDFSKVGVTGLKAAARYVTYDTGSNNNDFSIWDGSFSYAFSGALKNLSFKLVYESIDWDVKSDTSELRTYLSYKF